MKKFLLLLLMFLPVLSVADETGEYDIYVGYTYIESTQTIYLYPDSSYKPIGFNVHADNSVVTRSGGEEEDAKLTPWWNYRGKIQNVVVKEGVGTIGDYAFYECSRLKMVTIPQSVTRIGVYAFAHCGNLEVIDIKGKDKTSDIGAFLYCNKEAFVGDYKPVDPFLFNDYILCDDGQLISLGDYQSQLQRAQPVRAVGVVFVPDNMEHRTLAVTLFENKSVAFANHIPLNCNTSCDTEAYDGYQNSVNMKNTYENGYYSPLGKWMELSHQYGFSDYISSLAELKLLFKVRYHINSILRLLNGDTLSCKTNNNPVGQRTEKGIHRITVKFTGDLTGLDADIWVTAVEGVDGYSDIFMDGVKVNEMPGAWSNADENPKVQNYDLTSSADCNLMTATVSLYGKYVEETVTVTLKGYVNGVQKNMKVIEYRPGESRKTISFAADGPDFEYSRTRSEDRSEDCWYWTSTEDKVNIQDRALLFSMATGSYQPTPKTEKHKSRIVVSCYNYPTVSGVVFPKLNQQGSNAYYSLSGQRVTDPKPGIYIHDGRKVIFK